MTNLMGRLVGMAMAVVVVACTSTAPPDAGPTVAPTSTPPVVDPSPAPRAVVGVVIAPQPSAAAVLEDLRVLAGQRDEVDWAFAQARTSDVVTDLAGQFVDNGAALVCVIGMGRERIVTALALTVPQGRFCVGPSTPPADAAPNVLYVDARVEEGAYLAGTLAALVGGDAATAVITGRHAYAASRQLSAFEFGLFEAGGVAAAAVTGPVADAEAATAAADAQFAAGVGIVLVDAQGLNLDILDVVRQAARDQPADSSTEPPTTVGMITGPEVQPQDEPLSDEVLAIIRLLPGRVVVAAVDRLVTKWEAGVDSVGLTEGAVTFDLSASPLAAAHVDAMNQVRGELAAGDRTPLPAG